MSEPYITRKQKLLGLFPNTECLENGAPNICPVRVSKQYQSNLPEECLAEIMKCEDCLQSFWQGRYTGGD